MAINIWKTKTGEARYQVRVRDAEGNLFKTKSFRTRSEALAKEAEYVGLKERGVATMSGDAHETTVARYWKAWSRANRDGVSPGWKMSQDQMFRDHIEGVVVTIGDEAQRFGDTPLAHVSIPVIGQIIRAAANKGLGAQMQRHIYTLLRTMFGDAVEFYDMLPKNPARPKHHRAKVRTKKRAYLSPTESWELLFHAKDHYLAPAIWLQILGGLRVEAVIALRWKSVLWHENRILICSAWKKKIGQLVDYPKGGDWVYTPMQKELRVFLRDLYARKAPGADDFVATSQSGAMLPYETYNRSLKRLCKDAGVTVVTSHGLRHSTSELWVEHGASEADIGRLLHHKDAKTTQRYMHRTEERLQAIAQAISPKKFQAGTEKLEHSSVCMAREDGYGELKAVN